MPHSSQPADGVGDAPAATDQQDGFVHQRSRHVSMSPLESLLAQVADNGRPVVGEEAMQVAKQIGIASRNAG